MQNNRSVGTRYEEVAAAFLTGQGLTVVEQNFRCRVGEIDLVARDGRYLVFVEVKYRRTGHAGDSVFAVDLHKQQKIYRTAENYLKARKRSMETPCRFDVVGIDGDQIHWIRDAFRG